MVVQNKKDLRTLEIEISTWEIWKKMNKHHDWKIIEGDVIPTKETEKSMVKPDDISAFLGDSKKKDAPLAKETKLKNNGKHTTERPEYNAE